MSLPNYTPSKLYQKKQIDDYIGGIRNLINNELKNIKKYKVDMIVVEIQTPVSNLQIISISIGSILSYHFDKSDIMYINGNEKKIPKNQNKEKTVKQRLKRYNSNIVKTNVHINDASYNAIIAWQKISHLH